MLRYRPDTDYVDTEIPKALRDLLLNAHNVSLSRDTYCLDRATGTEGKGGIFRISQKKSHEVLRMSLYMFDMLDRMRDESGIVVRHVVDIGSGQVGFK